MLSRKNKKTFYWQGIDNYGQRINGTITCDNKKNATLKLKNRHISITRIKQKHQISQLSTHKISSKHITDFTLHLANLLQAGIPLIQSILIIMQETHNKSYKKILLEIKSNLENGYSLSETLSKQTKYFDKAYVGLVNAGEQSGQLDQCLSMLATFRLKQAEFKSTLVKASIYPITVIITAIIISFGLIFFAIPQLQNIFTDFGLQLPHFTQAIINISNTLSHHMLSITLTLSFVITTTVIIYQLSKSLQIMLQAIILKIPILGKLIRRRHIILWGNMMTTTLTAGVPLIQSLQAAQEGLKNRYFSNKMLRLQQMVSQGKALHEAMAQSKLFPQRVKSIVSISEQTGNLANLLKTIIALESKTLDQQLDQFSKLLEPIIMILLAAISGAIIFALYLPISQIGASL